LGIGQNNDFPNSNFSLPLGRDALGAGHRHKLLLEAEAEMGAKKPCSLIGQLAWMALHGLLILGILFMAAVVAYHGKIRLARQLSKKFTIPGRKKLRAVAR